MHRIVSFLLLITLLAACSGVPDQPGIVLPAGANPTALPTSTGQAAQDQSAAPAGDIAAPNQDSAAPAADPQTATISFAVWDHERRLYETLAKKFMEEHPNIKVVLVPLDDLTNVTDVDDDYSPLAQLRRIVSGADTAPASMVAPEMLGSGLLLDLRPQRPAAAAGLAVLRKPVRRPSHDRQRQGRPPELHRPEDHSGDPVVHRPGDGP